ncbi:MAG: hypothetical protein P4L99_17125 [Chthoniobacter sp.]|nr:hypothetical protein [Chthoniobacter sp.]
MSAKSFWIFTAVALLGSLSSFADAAETTKLSLHPPQGLLRADFYWIKTVAHPRAVVVLCPGRNDSGEEMVKEKEWQAFARRNDLGLVGISFASKMQVLAEWHGYHIASEGSGQALLEAVHRIYGRDLPLYLYGVSSGALFICQFVNWRPERVAGWCSYAAGEGGVQTRLSSCPPGIIACGEYDGSRYGAMLSYFKEGRAMGKPWLWVSLARTEHVISPPLEDFVRDYFAALMTTGKEQDCWVDVDRKEPASTADVEKIPSITAWLPQRKLLAEWQRIHEP